VLATNFDCSNYDSKIDIEAGLDATILGNGAVCDAGGRGGNFFEVAAMGILTLSSITLKGGSAATSTGGAIFNLGILTIRDATFIGNTASFGGAIANSGFLTVRDSTLTNNTATYGGGAVNINGNGASTSFLQCSITGNIETQEMSPNNVAGGSPRYSCLSGYRFAGAAAPECVACIPGQYVDQTDGGKFKGETGCMSCPPGKHSPAAAQGSCPECTRGLYYDEIEATGKV